MSLVSCGNHVQFEGDMHAVALHPSGLSMAVGFTDKLRLLHIYSDEVKPYKDLALPKCTVLQYSHGGQYLAAATGNVIYIISSYSMASFPLRGHQQSIRSLEWTSDDTKLCSAGIDGAVYEWSLAELKRVKEHVDKKCIYSAIALSPDGMCL